MIVVTITVKTKSYIEKIPEAQTRIHIDPGYYRDVSFIFEGKESLEAYRDHFIYGYLESLSRDADAPGFILRADRMEVTVKKED